MEAAHVPHSLYCGNSKHDRPLAPHMFCFSHKKIYRICIRSSLWQKWRGMNEYMIRIMLSDDCFVFVTSVIITDEQVQEHYDDFFEEIFVELEDKVKLALILRLFFKAKSIPAYLLV